MLLCACGTPTSTPLPVLLLTDTPTPRLIFPTATFAPTLTQVATISPSPTPEYALQFPAPGLIHDLHWSADGSQLAIAAGTDIHLYDSQLIEERVIKIGVWTERLAYSPWQAILGAALKDGSVRFWNSTTGAEICKFTAHSKGANSLSLQPSGYLLATTGTDIISRMWNISSVLAGGCAVKPVGKMIGSSFTAPDVSFSADGESFALVDIKDIYIHNGQSRKLIVILHGDLAIFDIALSTDGHWLAAAQYDSTVTLWDLTAKPYPTFTLLHFPQNKAKVYTWRVDFNAESSLLAGATSSGELLVWRLSDLQPIFSRSLGHPVTGLAFHPLTSALTVGTLDGFLYHYRVK